MTRTTYIIALLIFLALSIGYGNYMRGVVIEKDTRTIENMNHELDSLRGIIKLKDSLFRDHLRQCSFISKSQLDTNKYGDVFVLDARLMTNKYIWR